MQNSLALSQTETLNNIIYILNLIDHDQDYDSDPTERRLGKQCASHEHCYQLLLS